MSPCWRNRAQRQARGRCLHPSAFGALRLRVPWCTYRPLSAQRCPFRRGVAVGKMILDLCTQNGVGYLLHASRVQWVRVTICSESGQVRKEAAIRSLCRAPVPIEHTGRFCVKGPVTASPARRCASDGFEKSLAMHRGVSRPAALHLFIRAKSARKSRTFLRWSMRTTRRVREARNRGDFGPKAPC